MKSLLTVVLIVTLGNVAVAQIGWWSTFESQSLSKTDTFWNGADESGSFVSGKATFKNHYNTSWKVWDGFGVSNMTDTTTTGYTNQYSVISGSGVNYTQQYAVISQKATVVLDQQQIVKGCYVNNATYPALSMKDGDGFAKKFGGIDGNDKDYFRIIATGYIGNDSSTATFYLADFRDADNSNDYIVTNWTHWNLEDLGDVDSISFTFESSDTGQHGMNTPAFFCMDHFNADSFENTYDISDISFDYQTDVDSFFNGSSHDGGFVQGSTVFVNDFNKAWNSWTGWSMSSMADTVDATYNNQYSCISGSGFNRSETYLTGYKHCSVLFPYVSKTHFNTAYRSFFVGINNATYAYKTMLDGNNFAKKFGGVSGNDEDFLVLKVVGTLYSGEKTDTIEHYLADFRSDDNSKDYIQKQWSYLNLSPIVQGKAVVRLDFWIEGSDTGQYGLNTPAYFCMDNMFPLIGSVTESKPIRLNIYPNPTKDLLHIDVDVPVEGIHVIDLFGRNYITTTGSNKVVDVSELKTGIYFVRVKTNQGVITKQFIKE